MMVCPPVRAASDAFFPSAAAMWARSSVQPAASSPMMVSVCPSHASLGGAPSEHYTIVFNAFVLLQLFNQARALRLHIYHLVAVSSHLCSLPAGVLPMRSLTEACFTSSGYSEVVHGGAQSA